MSAPHPFLEELITWATPETTKGDLLAARAGWFSDNGEVFEEDRQIELRMAGFLEHYVCDREAPHLGRTPARARYELALKNETPERAAAFRAFTETQHGLYRVTRIIAGEVRVRGLFTGLTCDVTERRHIVGLTVGDVLEARLIPFAGHLHFSGAYVFHPHEAASLIVAEAKRREGTEEAALVHDCAQRCLKVDRYRQIAVDKIYDFDARRTA